MSFNMVNKNVKKAVLALFTFLLMVVLAILISSLISLAFELMATRSPPEPGFPLGQMTPTWQVISGVADFLLNIVTIAGTIIGSLFIFLVYYELTTGKTKVAPKTTKKSKKLS